MRVRIKSMLVVAAILAASVFLFLLKVKGEMADFEVNYQAGKRLRQAETLYRAEDEHYMFKYLPSSALLYAPLALLPLETAKAAWYAVVILSSAGLLFLSGKISNSKGSKQAILAILPGLILAKFFLREIQLGQINALVGLILVLSIRCLSSEERQSLKKMGIGSGLLAGLAAALKPYAVIFFPYFLIKKKSRALLSGTGFFMLAALVPSFYYGFQGNLTVHKEWLQTLSGSTPGLLTSQDNISIWALFAKWTGGQNTAASLSLFFLAGLALLFLLAVVKGKNTANSPALEGAALLVAIPLGSPLGWDYTLLLSALAVSILVKNFSVYPAFWKVFLALNFALLSLSLYDLLGSKLYAAFMSLSIPTLNALAILGYLIWLRFKGIQ